MEPQNKFVEFLKNPKKMVLAVASVIVLIALIAGISVAAALSRKPEFTASTLYPTLELVGELTTAKLRFSGHKEYKDSGIPIFNKSDFLMVYSATLRAGIDIEKVEIDVNDLTKTITVTLPAAEIQEVKIEPESIKYYDEKFSLFNFDAKEDSDKAEKLAEEEAIIEAGKTGILEHADKHAETLIKNLFQDLIPEDYTLVIK